MRVLSVQSTRAAFVPGRVASLLAHVGAGIEYDVAAMYPDVEGLDGRPVRHAADWRAEAPAYDVLHLWGDKAAGDMLADARRYAPRARVLVSVLGWPDSDPGLHPQLGARGHPDAYHLLRPLEADRLPAGAPRFFLPAHPGALAWPDEAAAERAAVLLVPATDVPGVKHGDARGRWLGALRAAAEEAGLEVRVLPQVAHATVLRELAAARWCLTSLEGVVDHLWLEAAALGCCPLAAPPEPKHLAAWTEHLGFEPLFPYARAVVAEPRALVDALVAGTGWRATIEPNRVVARGTWDAAAAGARWRDLFLELAE